MTTSALHRELGISARTPVDYQLLEKLASKQVREQADLDFKQKLYHPKNDKDKDELVKDVCAMANSGGGWIVCGISDANGAADQVIGVSLEPTTETDIHQMLQGRIDPPLTVEIRVYRDEHVNKNLVTIRIPSSQDRPHLMRVKQSDETRTFRVPIRKGPSTVWLDERGLRKLYQASFNHLEEKITVNSARFEQLKAYAKERFPGVSLVLLLTPQVPLVKKPDRGELQRFLREVDPTRFATNQGYSLLREADRSLSIGDRRYLMSQEHNRRHAFIEIGFDGTVAIGIQLGIDYPGISEQGRQLYTNRPDETSANEVEYGLIEALDYALQVTSFLTPTSDSDLLLSVIPDGNKPIIIRRNEGPWISNGLLRPRDESAPISSFRTISREIQASPTQTDILEILTDLILEALNQAGIDTIRVRIAEARPAR